MEPSPQLRSGSDISTRLAEDFYLLLNGTISLSHALGHFLLPSLIGNVIGGVALVAVGAHAEFRVAEE